MAATTPIKKSPLVIEWMAQAAPLREASTVKKMNDWSLLLSLNKIIHYFKKWTTGRGVFEKNLLSLQKRDADPLKN